MPRPKNLHTVLREVVRIQVRREIGKMLSEVALPKTRRKATKAA